MTAEEGKAVVTAGNWVGLSPPGGLWETVKNTALKLPQASDKAAAIFVR